MTSPTRVLQDATQALSGGMTTSELDDRLRDHFIKPEDRISQQGAGAVYLTEVTAPGSTRRADAVHIGLWQSRGGGRIDVCELKVDKGDWRRELDNPGKAEAWWPYCNAFWIVAPSTDIVPPDELPDKWGLMVPNPRRGSRRFKVIVKPEEREAKLTTDLLRTLLTNTETGKTHALREQRDQLWAQHQEQLRRAQRENSGLTAQDRERLEILKRLEGALGMPLDRYPWRSGITPEGAAEALKAFMQGAAAVEQAKRRTENILRELNRVAEGATEAAAELRKAIGTTK